MGATHLQGDDAAAVGRIDRPPRQGNDQVDGHRFISHQPYAILP